MAKTSAIQRNLKRIKLVKKFEKKRKDLKKIINNKKLSLDERFKAQLKLANALSNRGYEVDLIYGNIKLNKEELCNFAGISCEAT